MIETLYKTLFLKNKDSTVGTFCKGESFSELHNTRSPLGDMQSNANEEILYLSSSPVITSICNITVGGIKIIKDLWQKKVIYSVDFLVC